MSKLDRPLGTGFRSEVIARNGMVCSSHPLCSQIGLDILKLGGSAVDAAIATNAALGLMDPLSCGIGGDLFAIVYSAKDGQLHGLESVGRSPKSLDFDRMRKVLDLRSFKKIPPNGVLSITTPGCVAGWCELHSAFGVLPMSDILEPTVRYARNGFPVSEITANEWRDFSQDWNNPVGAIRDELMIGGAPPKKGDVVFNKGLAKSLEKISLGGKEAFYSGKIATKIESFLQSNGGFLQKSDFEDHRATWVDPISTSYRGYEVFEMPFPGQGASVLHMLNILEQFDFASMSLEERVHHMIEAKKIAFEDRAKYYSDPITVESRELMRRIISKDYGRRGATQIRPVSAELVIQGSPLNETSNTICLTTADSEGNMVSLIQSICHLFGSRIVVPGTGFALQSRGSSFSLDPMHPNCYAAGKKPFHTILPGFVMKDSKPFLSFAVKGGDMQPQGQLQVLSNIIDCGMNTQEAGDAPRWRHWGSSEPTESNRTYLNNGGYLTLESSLKEETGNRLKSRNHNIIDRVEVYGSYQGIMVKDGTYYGASESRRDGQACGF